MKPTPAAGPFEWIIALIVVVGFAALIAYSVSQ